MVVNTTNVDDDGALVQIFRISRSHNRDVRCAVFRQTLEHGAGEGFVAVEGSRVRAYGDLRSVVLAHDLVTCHVGSDAIEEACVSSSLGIPSFRDGGHGSGRVSACDSRKRSGQAFNQVVHGKLSFCG